MRLCCFMARCAARRTLSVHGLGCACRSRGEHTRMLISLKQTYVTRALGLWEAIFEVTGTYVPVTNVPRVIARERCDEARHVLDRRGAGRYYCCMQQMFDDT